MSGEKTTTPVRMRDRLLYGIGYLSVALTTDMTLTWLLKRYRPDPNDPRWTVLATALAFSLAMIVGRVMDAVADPLIGYWSDRIKTRWGRRKPFIFLGAPLLALMFVLIWTPPHSEATVLNGIYLALTVSAFFFAFTVVVCPYMAMLPEISADPVERVKLTSWQGAFNIIGAIGGMLLAGYLIDTHGYRFMSLFFAPLVLLASWAPLLVRTAGEGAPPVDFPLKQAIRQTLKNPYFVPYVIAQLLFWMALRIIMGALPKIVEVRAKVAETEQGIVMASGLLVAGLLFPLMPAVARRFGKKRVLGAAMVHFGVMMLLLTFMGVLPVPLGPLGQAVLIMVLAGPAVAALFTLPNAIVADIVDKDEELTGQRREAIYFGVQGLIVKAGLGLGVGIAALELGYFGETATNQGGFTANCLTAMAFALLAALVLTKYEGD